jgi:hypothetical protein
MVLQYFQLVYITYIIGTKIKILNSVSIIKYTFDFETEFKIDSLFAISANHIDIPHLNHLIPILFQIL